MALVPSPVPTLPFELKNGLLLILCVLGLGKMLYDTLFFDHYRP